MKNVIGLVGIAGLATTALAQPVETQVRYEVRIFNPSHNLGWAQSVNALPGERIEVRAVISYIGSSTVHGLGQTVFQPILSNWTTADTLVPQPGAIHPMQIGLLGGNLSTPPGYIDDLPGVYGRITPWTASAVNTSTFLRGYVHTNPGTYTGTFLRIARADVTNWIGVGGSTGAAAANNTNGNGGVNISQGSIGANRLPGSPPEWTLATQGAAALTNIISFKFSFTLSAATNLRTITIFTPRAGLTTETSASLWGQPGTRWHALANSTSPGTYRSDIVVKDGFINVIPTPASLALLGLGGLMVARRRR